MHPSKEIGLIAGDGDVPLMLLKTWRAEGYKPFVVNLTGRDDLESNGEIHRTYAMGQAGHIISFFKQHGVTDIVIIGKVHRPNFATLKADIKGLSIICKLLCNKMTAGDDGLLRFIRRHLEVEGFTIHPVQEFLPELINMPSGCSTTSRPTEEDKHSIKAGFIEAKNHGKNDKGQSIVVANGHAIGWESRQGTNALIRSVKDNEGRKILVKVSKPQQDMALDAPTIGVGTIKEMSKAGFSGLVIESGRVLIIDREQVINLCNQNGIFLLVTPDGKTDQ